MTDEVTAPSAGLSLTMAATAPPEWESFLSGAPAADYTHTRHWHEVVCAHRPAARQLWLTARREGRLIGGLGAILQPKFRRVAGVLPLHRLDSGVEGTSGGPLVASDLPPPEQDRVFAALVETYRAQRPRGAATVTMALNPLSEGRFGTLVTAAGPWRRQDSPTAMVSLTGGVDTVAADKLVMNKRNERNRGLKRGARIEITHEADRLAAYYPLYVQACTLWGQRPTELGLLQGLLGDPSGRVFFTCVSLADKVIGGHLCLHCGDRVFAWNGVTDPAYARTHFPATLCFWGDIEEACRRGAAWLDFGASGGVHSLAGFKRYFGAEQMERGFYVGDSALMKILRLPAGWRDRLAVDGPSARWHDQAAQRDRDGAGA